MRHFCDPSTGTAHVWADCPQLVGWPACADLRMICDAQDAWDRGYRPCRECAPREWQELG